MSTFNLDDFKMALANNEGLRKELSSRADLIDYDNGTFIIYRENLDKYLEKYMCQDEDDLSNTLWFSMGVWVKVVD